MNIQFRALDSVTASRKIMLVGRERGPLGCRLKIDRRPEPATFDRSRSLGPVPTVRVDGHLPAAGAGELRVMH